MTYLISVTSNMAVISQLGHLHLENRPFFKSKSETLIPG